MELEAVHRTCVAIMCIVLLSIPAAQMFGFVYADYRVPSVEIASDSAYTQHEKGLLIDVRVLLWNERSPSFTELKKGQFTLLGTYVKADLTSGDWRRIAAWIKSAHKSGFRTFIMIGVPLVRDVTMAVDWCKKAASMGTDVVELDELIAKLNATEGDVVSIIEAGLAVNPKLQFIITEYNLWYFQQAYSWTSQYPSVRVADDNYDDKTRIDMNIETGAQYGKRALTWLIFAQGSENFDCFVHLDDWISYVKQRDTDVLFYWIDHGGTWPQQWATVMSF